VDTARWLLDGRASVDEVRERLGVDIPDGEYVTLGGYLFDAFGHIPEEGEQLEVGEWHLRVAEMDKRRIAKVVARHGPGPDRDTGEVPVVAAASPNGAGILDPPARVGAPTGDPSGLE